jgi:hypothetical protein
MKNKLKQLILILLNSKKNMKALINNHFQIIKYPTLLHLMGKADNNKIFQIKIFKIIVQLLNILHKKINNF